MYAVNNFCNKFVAY